MIEQKSIYSRLISVGSRHPKSAKKFTEFSDLVKRGITSGNFAIDGIVFMSYPIADLFSVLFAGTTIVFALSVSTPSDNGEIGRITCFSERQFPKKEWEEIGSFTFKADGKTNERDVQHGDLLYLDQQYGANFIAMRYLCIALLK